MENLITVTPIMGIHIFAGIGAIFVGIAKLFFTESGTRADSKVGLLWLTLMAVMLLTSFDIKVLDPGNFGPVHGVSVVALLLLGVEAWAASTSRVKVRNYSLRTSYILLIVILGAIISTPGGVLNQWFIGG